MLLECRLALAAMEHMTPRNYSDLSELQSEFDSRDASRREGVARPQLSFHRQLYTIARQPQTLHFVRCCGRSTRSIVIK